MARYDVPPVLQTLGVSDLWQAACLCPQSWLDLRATHLHFHALPEGFACVQGKLTTEPVVAFRPRLKMNARLTGRDGVPLGLVAFGDSRPLVDYMRRHSGAVRLCGQVSYHNGRAWLMNPKPLIPKLVGRVIAVYPSARGAPSEQVASAIEPLLDEALPLAAAELTQRFSPYTDPHTLLGLAGSPAPDYESLLRQMHRSPDPDTGAAARDALLFLSAYSVLLNSRQQLAPDARRAPLPISCSPARIKSLPFTLTDEQIRAVNTLVTDLSRDVPMKRILMGSVGSGKTVVFGLAAAAVIDAGGRVAVLCPSQALAQQTAARLQEFFPDIFVRLVIDRQPGSSVGASIQVGTTSLLYRKMGLFDLIIVDEQQKFSRSQREQLIAGGSHLLEVTATCVPRTQALVRYGAMDLTCLCGSPMPKDIRTKIWEAGEKISLFDAVKGTISSGRQVLVIYPKREKDNERQAALAAAGYWEKVFPGRVRVLVGSAPVQESASVLMDMRAGRADVLVATTVAEVGLDLPKLERVVVVRADLFGLSQLHQIRGRVARHGGTGHCDLFLPEAIASETRERLEVLVHTQDGFKVSEADLLMRGGGDMDDIGERQSGAMRGIAVGADVSFELLDYVARVL